ncbi:hypothetical protein BC939DRAFT_191052 [Gamsiella multidivaricata]|uniref:uncharacterized protein n=1 Tax=Gamsiella multidivaricata TaxID=101098 RepID=UPI002220969F|nr:uncharacterized protein BC939DRAFT_191052 [Gamsiella multidivaricata]KAI7822128.1 hypothetical protein BC939DRAFT_191052 [Gamsiella multidivaricata]
MLEASSIRSRKHSSSSMDLKSSNTGTFAKEKTGSSMANDSGTSLSGPFEKMSESFLQAAGSGKRQEHDGQDDVEIKGASPPRTQRVRPPISEKQPGSKTYRGTLSAEDLGGGLLDDVTEDTDVIREPEGIFEGQGGAEGNEEDGGYEKHKKQRNLMEAPDSENNGHGDSSCTHVDEAEAQHPRDHDGDDGDVAMVDQEDDDDEKREEEATPVAHTDDESELPEDEGSHVEDEDADAEEDEEDEVDEEDEEDEGVQPSKLEAKKATSLYSQKPTLNRPAQVIEEDVKDSGDEKDSDDELSDPVDTDDSDSDEEMADRSSKAQISAAAFSGMAAVSSSRPALGGRKRSLRGASRNTTQHEDSAGLEADNHKDTKDQRWDKGSESETLEENGVEEENAVEEETVEGGDDVEDEGKNECLRWLLLLSLLNLRS